MKRDAILLPSASRTAAQSVTLELEEGSHLTVHLDVTAVSGIPSLTVSIFGLTPTGKEYLLLAGAAVTTAVANVYHVGPGLPATANVSANLPLPKRCRVKVAVGSADACTYSLSAMASKQ